ncbi:hypothetical protein BpOF4_22019 (plasmid) [Alkalihalophilus pseudofirmus OF4]|uniref:Uncharacterized protein n=1 Tax=Alkalihalophilus pseudofirmus (strain ATCC BAA-2126 / JCM 17055 / OF4) TaxID=398511 RepID=D3G223_ALKPO|nr:MULTISPECIES: hypothetical protein [Alkalihalophilus]ADC52399.1 hypothetical protein BpOF4_22019 [Alkalihalophilus pseudofirmus OF4]MED1603429.1 hypothetical protein [Alkalihalophilus marmarensis]
MSKIIKYIMIVGIAGLLFAGAFLSNERGKETIITSTSNNAVEEYINSNPEDVDAKKELAFRYLIQHNYSEALNLLEVIRELDPGDTIPLNQMVIANIELGNYQEAIDLSGELLKFNNYNPIALTNVAEAYFIIGEETEFINHLELAFQAAVLTEGEETVIKFYTLINQLKEDFLELKNQGKDSEAYLLLSKFDSFSKRTQIAAIDRAYSNNIKEANPNELARKGILEIATEEPADAIATFNQLITNFPNYNYGYYLLGDLYYRISNFEGLSQLLTLTPTNSNVSDFIDFLLDYKDNPEVDHLETIELIFEQEENQPKQILSHYAMLIAEKTGNAKKQKEYFDIYNSGYDDDYIYSINRARVWLDTEDNN